MLQRLPGGIGDADAVSLPHRAPAMMVPAVLPAVLPAARAAVLPAVLPAVASAIITTRRRRGACAVIPVLQQRLVVNPDVQSVLSVHRTFGSIGPEHFHFTLNSLIVSEVRGAFPYFFARRLVAFHSHSLA